MEKIIGLLGFSEPAGIFWNILVYVGIVLLIIAVMSARRRKEFFILGPLMLLFYSFFYLHNLLFAGLHIIVVASGILNFRNVKNTVPVILGLSFFIPAALFFGGTISGLWCWFGIFGLVGINFGLTQLPRRRGFAILAGASLLMFVYSFSLQIWIFAVFNIILFFMSLFKAVKGNRNG